MSTHYEHLGVAQDATAEQIKVAYRQKALKTHPDRGGSAEAFQLINQAYEVLSNPMQRAAYDASLCSPRVTPDSFGSNVPEYVRRLKRQELKFTLVPNPGQYDLYAYFNTLFKGNRVPILVPGQSINETQREELWDIINYADYCSGRTREQLKSDKSKITKEVKEKLSLIKQNIAQMILFNRLVIGGIYSKNLYDLAMGFTDEPELLEMERLLGGKEQLIRYLKKDGELDIDDGIYLLFKAKCLTPTNFKKIMGINTKRTFSDLSMIFTRLHDAKLLTQENFERAVQHHQYAHQIDQGQNRLKQANILTQKLFELVVSSGAYAETLGYHLEALHLAGLLNDENIQIIIQKKLEDGLDKVLDAMQNEGLLNEQTSQAFAWKGPEELEVLTHRIHQMIAHGIYLLSTDVEKGKTALLLGLALKQDLKSFFELPLNQQEQKRNEFQAAFFKKVHSKDQEMSIHRSEWKGIVANIVIALTGIGLIALAVHYALKKQCFFANTQRQHLIEGITTAPWLSSSCYMSGALT